MNRTVRAKEVLASEEFRIALDVTEAVFNHPDKIKFCLIGGLAVGFYANPPVTVDVDFLVRASVDEVYARLEDYEGSDVLHGWQFVASDYPESAFKLGFPHGIVRLYRRRPTPISIDFLVTGDDEFLRLAVSKADSFSDIGRVSRPEDLIVMKRLACRSKDFDDMIALYSTPGIQIDREYVERTLSWLQGR